MRLQFIAENSQSDEPTQMADEDLHEVSSIPTWAPCSNTYRIMTGPEGILLDGMGTSQKKQNIRCGLPLTYLKKPGLIWNCARRLCLVRCAWLSTRKVLFAKEAANTKEELGQVFKIPKSRMCIYIVYILEYWCTGGGRSWGVHCFPEYSEKATWSRSSNFVWQPSNIESTRA